MPGGWSANLEEVIEGERTGYQPPPFHDRFWEDVREGDELPQLLMPITVTRCIYMASRTRSELSSKESPNLRSGSSRKT